MKKTSTSAPTAGFTTRLQEAWRNYHATLEEMRIAMEATPRFRDQPAHRAKAYHTLMEMQAMAYNFAIAPRLQHPRIYVNSGWQTNLYTLGQNAQDFIYGVTFVDGRQRYRLKGRLGDLSLVLLQTFNGLVGADGVKVTGNYDWADFKLAEGGRFEIALSATAQPGNWIRLDEQASYQFILIRRALTDWHGDPGEFYLERIGDVADPHDDADEFDEAAMAARMDRATAFIRYLTLDFNIALYNTYVRNAGGKNKLSLLPGTTTSQVGSPSSNYAMAIFELDDDEALIVELDKLPDGAYWSFQLGDVWSRSLDYSNRHSSLNNREVVADADGRLRVVIALKDPGVNNWLDPCGHHEGTLVFRNYRARSAPVPASRKVKLAELGAALPADTRRVTPSERMEVLARRRAGQLKLYGE